VARSLTLQRSIVPLHQRKEYISRLQERRDYYTRANCRFWVFEETGLPGAFIEFAEAGDPATLAAAHSAAPGAMGETARIYQEVEIR
jgi:hypothetical protein